MNDSYVWLTGESAFLNYFIPYTASFDGQSWHIIIEVLIFIGTIWIIFKRSSTDVEVKLKDDEVESLISEYEPESLVPDVPDSHHALNPRVVTNKIDGLYIIVNGTKSFNFGTHDYLGFIGDDEIERNTVKCVNIYGVGSCGPRGFYGTSVRHLKLEEMLAQFLDTEDSILFSYGFATAASTIPAYSKKNDIIFADEKCNFAIQQGIRASKSEVKYFKHNDMTDLERILEETRSLDLLNTRKARKSRRFLVVEGIYLNTGKICPLPRIIQLCKKYKVRNLIDESISFGVLGKTGRGVTEYFGVKREDVDLMMGSFEYAFASIGGFCTGSRFLVDHLLAAALGYMFSASLPPLLVEASIQALHKINRCPEILGKLNILCKIMHNKLSFSIKINKYFIVSGCEDSPVHVLSLHDKYNKNEIVDSFLDSCLHWKVVIARAAFLPQIDTGMTRLSLRITTTVNHTEELITYLIQVLERTCDFVFETGESVL